MLKKLLLACTVLSLAQGPSFAFHDQGSADCESCHISHNSQDGATVQIGPSGGDWLLKGVTASETCLVCHAEGYGSVLAMDPLNPGPEKGAGNFVFLLEDNLNDAPGGATNPIPGDAAGHNLDAPSYGLVSDFARAANPDISFPVDRLGCTSCHDPHGNENYRMLRGAGSFTIAPGPVTFTFSSPAPQAEGISLSSFESQTNHAAYESGMSQWCSNCHNQVHRGASAVFFHRTQNALSSPVITTYNSYNGDLSAPTTQASAYLPLVAFEDTSMTTSSTQGPFGGGSKLMCLSCHRAHASSGPSAGRWDFNVQQWSDEGAISGSYAIPNPYTSPTQGPLCLKCHSSGPGPGG